VTGLFLWIIFGFITGYLGDKKGYGWLVCIGLALLGLIGLVIMIFLPDKTKENKP
jgi:hypothetical protein